MNETMEITTLDLVQRRWRLKIQESRWPPGIYYEDIKPRRRQAMRLSAGDKQSSIVGNATLLACQALKYLATV
jgi:hypothetical protein